MTELEEQFFKTFGIEPKLLDCNSCGASRVALGLCAEVKCEREHPQITAEVSLELICKLAKYWVLEAGLPVRLFSYDISDLKNEILKESLNLIRIIKNEDRKERFISEVVHCLRRWRNEIL